MGTEQSRETPGYAYGRCRCKSFVLSEALGKRSIEELRHLRKLVAGEGVACTDMKEFLRCVE